jgi:spermidine synthase
MFNAAWAWSRGPGATALSPKRIAALGTLVGIACVSLIAWQPRPFALSTDSTQVLYYREGVASTVEVGQDRQNPRRKFMLVDSVRVGESFGGVDRKQQALAHFGFLISADHPPESVLAIGLGTGILIGEVIKHPSVNRIDCVEISESVIEAAHHFDDVHGRILEHDRVHIIHDDGVNYLRRSNEPFDAIISDAKSQTTHAGNAVFHSTDYYELCREHLPPTGMFLQWVPLDVPPDEFRTILNTFRNVFPHASIWADPPLSVFLVGSQSRLRMDFERANRVLQQPYLASLRRYGWVNIYDFLSLRIAEQDSLKNWLVGHDTINSLDYPVLEFYSPAGHAVSEYTRTADNLDALGSARCDCTVNIALSGIDNSALRSRSKAVEKLLEGMALLHRGEPSLTQRGQAVVEEALALAPEHEIVRLRATQMYVDHAAAAQSEGDLAAALALYRRARFLAASDDAMRTKLDEAIAALSRQRAD